jgi:hypothetical protein
MSLQSEAEHFALRVVGLEKPASLNRMHSLRLMLTTADGKPVAGATIFLSGRRLYAPNSLPTAPKIAPGLTAGAYQVEGLRFHMPGEWRLTFDIESAGIRDRATLDIVVK